MARQHPEALKTFNTKVIDEFRVDSGRVGGRFEGADLLLLSTTGARSGERRVNPLQYVRVGGRITVVGAYAGADLDPAWVHNLRANPHAHIELGEQSFAVLAHELPADEREPVWAQIITAERGFADYQSRTHRLLPLFTLDPV